MNIYYKGLLCLVLKRWHLGFEELAVLDQKPHQLKINKANYFEEQLGQLNDLSNGGKENWIMAV